MLVGESKGDGDGKGDSSYQCTEPGCNEDCTTQAEIDLHTNLLDHHVSPVLVNETESSYDKVEMEWVRHFQSMSLEGKSSTEVVAVATEPLTSASQHSVRLDGLFIRRGAFRGIGWTLHKKGASARFAQNVRHYLTQKFNTGRYRKQNS